MAHAYSQHLAQDAQPIYTFWGDHPAMAINACFIFVTLGQISLHFLLGTLLFSSSVQQRNASLHNLLIVTVLASVPPCILYYAGHIFDPDPPVALCVVQAVFTHGTEPMFTVAALALVLDVLFDTAVIVARINARNRKRLLIALPYVVFGVFTVWGAVLAGRDLDCVRHQDNNLYCTITYSSFAHGIGISCVIVVIITFALELYAFVVFRRTRRSIPRTGQQFVQAPTSLRIIGFTLMQLFYFVLLGVGFYMGHVAMYLLPSIYWSMMPLATFLIFGLTTDCLTTWISWVSRRRPRPASTIDQPVGENAEKRTLSVPPVVDDVEARKDELEPVIHIC